MKGKNIVAQPTKTEIAKQQRAAKAAKSATPAAAEAPTSDEGEPSDAEVINPVMQLALLNDAGEEDTDPLALPDPLNEPITKERKLIPLSEAIANGTVVMVDGKPTPVVTLPTKEEVVEQLKTDNPGAEKASKLIVDTTAIVPAPVNGAPGPKLNNKQRKALEKARKEESARILAEKEAAEKAAAGTETPAAEATPPAATATQVVNAVKPAKSGFDYTNEKEGLARLKAAAALGKLICQSNKTLLQEPITYSMGIDSKGNPRAQYGFKKEVRRDKAGLPRYTQQTYWANVIENYITVDLPLPEVAAPVTAEAPKEEAVTA